MRKPMSAPAAALMPTARQGFARTYASVVSTATFVRSCTVVWSWPSICFALSSFAWTIDFTSASLLSPSDCTVFNRSCASETTFWMSRAIGEGVLPVLPGFVAVRIVGLLGLVRALRRDVRAPRNADARFPPGQIRQVGFAPLSARDAADSEQSSDSRVGFVRQAPVGTGRQAGVLAADGSALSDVRRSGREDMRSRD